MSNSETVFFAELKKQLCDDDFRLLSQKDKQLVFEKILKRFRLETRKRNKDSKLTAKQKMGYVTLEKFSRRTGLKIKSLKGNINKYDHVVINNVAYINKIQIEKCRVLQTTDETQAKPPKSTIKRIISFIWRALGES